MENHLVSPLRGIPRTICRFSATGERQFKILPRVFTPTRAKILDELNRWVAIIVAVGSGLDLLGMSQWTSGTIGPLAASAIVVYGLTMAIACLLLKRRHTIVLTADEIRVPGLFGWRRFDRRLVNGFVLLRHDKAMVEERYIQHKRATSKTPLKLKPYFGDSFHVVLDYAGQRIDLLTVYGVKPANAIRARLELCNALLDQDVGINGGRKARPSDEWVGQPGGI